jgi:hypothetical protein
MMSGFLFGLVIGVVCGAIGAIVFGALLLIAPPALPKPKRPS